MSDTITARLSFVNNRAGTYQTVTPVLSSLGMDVYEIRRLRLRQAIDEKFAGNVKQCAEHIGMKPPQLHRWLSTTSKDRRRIEWDSARTIEDRLDLPERWMDVLSPSSDGQSLQIAPSFHDESGVREQHAPTTARRESVTIPQYDVAGAMGNGGLMLADQPGTITDWHVTPEWITKNVPHCTGVSNLCIVTGFGDSMRPLYNPGDPLLVDTGVRKIEADAVYFFRVGAEGYIKRIQRIPGKGYLVKSANPEYETWTLTPDMDVQVLGRVLMAWRSEKF